MVRIMKVMGEGLEGGTSFMEDYTYHLDKTGGQKVLGSHMLEVCPSIAAGKPSLEVHPLGIGGKDAPARLVFNSPAGPAMNVSPIDMGNRFRVVVNEVEAVEPEHDLPKLPVARALWIPQPDLKVGAAAWILAGAAHHSVYTQQVDVRHLEAFCEMADVEMVVIDADTKLRSSRMNCVLAKSSTSSRSRTRKSGHAFGRAPLFLVHISTRLTLQAGRAGGLRYVSLPAGGLENPKTDQSLVLSLFCIKYALRLGSGRTTWNVYYKSFAAPLCSGIGAKRRW